MIPDVDDERLPERSEPSQSIDHAATLSTIVAAIMARNSERHIPNKS